MASEFTSRSLQSVRRVGPESSRILRIADDLKEKGFAQAANQVALEGAAVKMSESPVDTPMQRQAREAAQRALTVGRQAAIQGDFDPAAVIAPMKQQFFGALGNLPLHKQTALLNRFEPEFREQRLLNIKEQQSFLELKEAQRKGKMAQAADAAKVQVQQQLADIDPLMPPKKQAQAVRNIVTNNPEALADDVTLRSISMVMDDVNKGRAARQSRSNMEFNARINMLQNRASAGADESVINKILRGKGGLKGAALEVAKSAKEQRIRGAETDYYTDLLTDLEKSDYRGVLSFEKDFKGKETRANPMQRELYDSLTRRKLLEEGGATVDRTVEIIDTQLKYLDSIIRIKDDGTNVVDVSKEITSLLSTLMEKVVPAQRMVATLGRGYKLVDKKGNLHPITDLIKKHGSAEQAILKTVTTPSSFALLMGALSQNITASKNIKSSDLKAADKARKADT